MWRWRGPPASVSRLNQPASISRRPAEAVAADPPRARGDALGVRDERVDVVDRDVEVDGAAAARLATRDPALVPFLGAEVDEPGERLAVGDARHAATIPAAIRSAIAAIV